MTSTRRGLAATAVALAAVVPGQARSQARSQAPTQANAPPAAAAQGKSPAAKPAPVPIGVHGAAPGEHRAVSGRVVRGGEERPRPVAGIWVVLHRVGTDHAAPLDSTRTDVGGRYVFHYRTSGDPRAIYFVSSVYGGVAYFTSPLTVASVTGEPAELVVHDTTSAPVPIRIRARHVVFSAPDTAPTRTVVEVVELSNDSSVTRIAAGDTGAVWESAMLAGARDARAARSDFSEDAVRFRRGQVRLSAPFAPGLKQFSYTYEVPVASEYRLTLDAPADVIEVLIEDPLGRATGSGLMAAGPTTVSERTFARFVGQNARSGAVITVSTPGRGAASASQLRVLAIVAALGAVLLVGLARTMMRRADGARPAAPPADAAALRQQLVALDEAFAKVATPTPDERADHWEARARLTQQITDAVAREQGLS